MNNFLYKIIQYLYFSLVVSLVILLASKCYASELSSVIAYDQLNRLKTYSLTNTKYQLAISYTYDAAGNITQISSNQVVETTSLADAIRYLQVLSGGNPAGVSKDDDISHDERIGLEEAMGTLQRLSQ